MGRRPPARGGRAWPSLPNRPWVPRTCGHPADGARPAGDQCPSPDAALTSVLLRPAVLRPRRNRARPAGAGPAVTDTAPRLSLLDRSRTRTAEPDAAALQGTVARAVHAEEHGFDRFWVAGHHGVPGVAGAAPAVLLAGLAGRTTSIRLGSAGGMLPRSEEHTSELQSRQYIVCRLLLEK